MAATRSCRPSKPRAGLLGGAAHAVVDDLDVQRAAHPPGTHLERAGVRVLLRVADGLGDDVVGRRLGGGVDPDGGDLEHRHRHRRTLREPVEGTAEPEVRQLARVLPVRELAQLVDRELQLHLRRERPAARGGPGRRANPRRRCAGAPPGRCRRCCAPSWMLRAMRRRSASPASTIRPRDARQPLGEQLALGDDGGQQQRRERRHRDVELQVQRAARDRLERERAEQVRGVPHGDADGDGRRRGSRRACRSARPPRAGPGTSGTPAGPSAWNAIRLSRATREHHRRRLEQPGARRQRAAGTDARRCASGTTIRAPQKSPSHQVRHTVRSASRGEHVAGQQRQRADGRADQRPGRRAPTTIRSTPRRRLRAAGRAADQPLQEQRRDDDLEHVPRRLPERRAPGQRRVVVREQVAGHDAGPEPHAARGGGPRCPHRPAATPPRPPARRTRTR